MQSRRIDDFKTIFKIYIRSLNVTKFVVGAEVDLLKN